MRDYSGSRGDPGWDAPTTKLPVSAELAERIAQLHRPVRTKVEAWKSLIRRLAAISTLGALALLSIKPFVDIIGERADSEAVDIGSVLTLAGAALMAAGMLAFAYSADRIPRRLVLVLALLGMLLLLSGMSYLLASGRAELLALFDVRRYAIYGTYRDPHSSIPTEAVRLITSFAPIMLIAVMLKQRSVLSPRVLKLAAQVIISAALLHCLLAWLQVTGVVSYSFYFNFPGIHLGRPSGGYFHPMSLGRLLIFAVVILYVLREKLHWGAIKHYLLVGLFSCTAAISLHRISILCIVIAVAAFELPRLRGIEWRAVNRKLALTAAAAIAAVLVLVGMVWGDSIFSRASVMLSTVGSWDVRSDKFLNGRGAIWSDVADILGRSAGDVWLFGFGYEPWDMHNDLLRAGIVWGLLGAVLTISAMIMFYLFTRRMITKKGRWFLVTIYLILIIFSLTLKPTSYPYFMWLFFFCHMLIITFHHNSPDRRETPEKSAAP